jgi:hypothetical protein
MAVESRAAIHSVCWVKNWLEVIRLGLLRPPHILLPFYGTTNGPDQPSPDRSCRRLGHIFPLWADSSWGKKAATLFGMIWPFSPWLYIVSVFFLLGLTRFVS